jgi:3-hydroxybutyryl-CoA dehydrogenase
MQIKKVVVVGSGMMGAGIGQLCAQAGIDTVITDVSLDLSKKGLGKIEKGLAGRVEKGKTTKEEMDKIMAKLRASGDLNDVKDADFVIESVVENLEIKQKVFTELDKLAKPGVILATNTTALSISAIASVTKRPDKVVQMHFFNPPVVMKLCEIMPGKKTSPDTLKAAEEFAKLLGKDPVVCKNEAPAGIVSRILGALLNEATWLLEHGVADAKDIDKAMTLGANHPMGPIALLDLIGLDTHRAKMQTLAKELNDPRYKHPAIVDKLIAEKRLGKKAGKGFYDYSEEKK